MHPKIKRVLRCLGSALVGAASLLTFNTAQAQIDFSDDFQSQTPGSGISGWTTFINAFSSDCSTYLGGYSYDQTVTNAGGIVATDTGTSIVANVYADYANGDLAEPTSICMETNVFQQVLLVSGMDGDYEFTFDHEPGSAPGARTLAFVTVFDPSFSVIDTETVDTTGAAASGILSFTIQPEWLDAGNNLQFGFRTTQVGYADSGRFYDNVSFAVASSAPPPTPNPNPNPEPANPNAIPVLPLWALLLSVAAAGLIGSRRLRR